MAWQVEVFGSTQVTKDGIYGCTDGCCFCPYKELVPCCHLLIVFNKSNALPHLYSF